MKQKDKEKKKKQPKTPKTPTDGQTKLTSAAAFSLSSKDFPKLKETPIPDDELKPAAKSSAKAKGSTAVTAKTSSEKVSFAATTVKKPKPPPIPKIHYHEVSIVIKLKFDNDRLRLPTMHQQTRENIGIKPTRGCTPGKRRHDASPQSLSQGSGNSPKQFMTEATKSSWALI